MLASPSGEPFADAVLRYVRDDAWGLDTKIDGHRMMVHVDEGGVRVRNRRGELAEVPDVVRRAFPAAPAGGVTFDAEWLPDERVLCVFDLVLGAEPDMPLLVRKQVLASLIGQWQPPGVRVVPWATGIEAKADLVKRVLAANLEGLVAKRLDSRYVPAKKDHDRSPHWVKVKNVHDLDCVVTRLGVDGKHNMAVALWRDGALVEVGEVSALTGDGPRIVRLLTDEPDARPVVTVTYLYTGVNDRLVQPVTARLRPKDKTISECTWDQLIYPNREAYA